MADPRTPKPCRLCNEPIVWARHAKSKKPMPFDAEPSRDGEWRLVLRTSENEVYATYVEGGGLPQLRVPHFHTCTNYKR